MSLEDVKHAPARLRGRLPADRAEGRCRGHGDSLKLLAGLPTKVDQALLDDALDAIQGAVDPRDVGVLDAALYEPDEALVDDCGGAAGLTDERVATELGHRRRQGVDWMFSASPATDAGGSR